MFYAFVINSPEEIAGDYYVEEAVFGYHMTVGLRRAYLVHCGSTDKDLRRLKPEKVAGKIVMFDRGSLDFTIVAAMLQKMQALALIIVNNSQGPPTKMYAEDNDPVADQIQIPCYMMSKSDGLTIRKVMDRQIVDASFVTEIADVYAWGNGLNGQLGLPAPHTFESSLTPAMVVRHQSVREIGCGGNFSACLLDTGAVFTWGSPEYGQLGHESYTDLVCQPRQVEALPNDSPTVTIAVGYFHVMAANEMGQLYSWGWNEFGQLGLNHRTNTAIPQLVSRLEGKKVRSLAGGYFHSLALCINFRAPPKMTKEELRKIGDEEAARRRKDRKFKKSKEHKESMKAARKRRGQLGASMAAEVACYCIRCSEFDHLDCQTRKNNRDARASMGGGGDAGGKKRSKRSRSSVSAGMLA